MPLYPLKLLSAEEKNFFPFLLKMPDQVCCANVSSIWPKAHSTKEVLNELKKKEKQEEIKIKLKKLY